ncbi:hypothetical protein HID58_071700, partial [Brassica napus]
PLEMTMDIQLPTDEVIEVEFEYIKIEKHCFTCFSLFHEESDCPQRPRNAPPPKDRRLGITQRIALQRIEAEKNRHDERRGYRRPEVSRQDTRRVVDSHARRSSRDDREMAYYQRRSKAPRTEPSTSVRSARSMGPYARPASPPIPRRDRDRRSPVSSASHRTPLLGFGRLANPEGTPLGSSNSHHRGDRSHLSRSLKERLGSSGEKSSTPCKSKERPSALERLSEPDPIDDLSPDRVHIADSGRLQYIEVNLDSDGLLGDEEDASPILEPPRQLTLIETKAAGKRRVTRSATKKFTRRSPLQNLKANKPARSSSAACRKLYSGGAKVLPCDKKLNACRRSIIQWTNEQQNQSNMIIKTSRSALEKE